jgi:hypothetical protein
MAIWLLKRLRNGHFTSDILTSPHGGFRSEMATWIQSFLVGLAPLFIKAGVGLKPNLLMLHYIPP